MKYLAGCRQKRLGIVVSSENLKVTSRSSALFVTGSSAIWGAERSLIEICSQLAIAKRDVSLLASHTPLVQIWRREGLGPVHAVRAFRGRVTRNFGFIRKIVSESPKHSRLVVFDYYLLPMIALLEPRGFSAVVVLWLISMIPPGTPDSADSFFGFSGARIW
jgi:hypothetical protein